MSAIVLVGGEGRRLGAVASQVPKPLIEVAGEPFLHWVCRWVEAQGEHVIMLAACHLSEQVEQWAAREEKRRKGVQFFVAVEPELLGTGGAILNAAACHSDDLYLVLNGDSATFVSLHPAREWLASDPSLDGIIVGKPVEDAGRFGSLDIGPEGLLLGFREKQPGQGMINAGIYLLRRRLLDMPVTKMSIEYDCFPKWLREGARIGVVAALSDFLDIGTRESLVQAAAFIEQNKDRLEDPGKLVPVRRCT